MQIAVSQPYTTQTDKNIGYKTASKKTTTRKDSEMMVERVEQNTFNDQVLTTFNDLPKAIRMIDNKKVFYRESKKYSDSALARTLSL